MSEKQTSKYLTLKNVVFDEKTPGGISIDFDLKKINEKRETIKNVYREPLVQIKENDHFFLAEPNSALFYNSYKASLAKAAAAEFALVDLEALYYTNTTQKLGEMYVKVEGIKTWQITDTKLNDFLDEQISKRKRLPPRYRWLVFWKRISITLKWYIFLPFTLAYYVIITPGIIGEILSRKRKARRARAERVFAMLEQPEVIEHITPKRPESAETEKPQDDFGCKTVQDAVNAVFVSLGRADAERPAENAGEKPPGVLCSQMPP